MSTKILVPRGSGEGGIGHHDNAWGQAYFDSGHFSKELYLSGQSIGAIVSQGGLGGKWDDATTPGDIYYTGGNVGIGTTNPSVALEVLDSENNAYAAKIVNIGGDGYGAFIKTYAGTGENYPILDLENTSSNVFRVEAKGNVGIGTSSPIGPLHIQSNTGNFLNLTKNENVIGSTADAFCEIHGGALAGVTPSMGGAIGFILKDSDGAGSGSNTEGIIYFKTKLSGGSLTEKMRIDANGNVGIGTTSPGTKLSVAGSAGMAGIKYTSGTAHDVLSLDIGCKNGTTGLVVKNLNGNVGIGTTSPSVALEVLDSENNAYAAKIVNIGGDGYGALIKTAAGASENYPILDLENTSSNVFRVEAKGNVGIGTTNPAQKLDVYGNIAVNGTIVHTSDDRVKHNEQPIVGAVETLGKITPKKYIKTNEMYDVDHDFQLDADGNPIDENGESVEHRIEAGVIAQQVLTVDELAFAVTPEGVDEDGDATRPHGLDYNSLFTYAIAAIQEQQEIIENLKSRIETLEK